MEHFGATVARDMNSNAGQAVRAMTQQEQMDTKLKQATEPAPVAIPSTLILVKQLVESARIAFYESQALVYQTVGDTPNREIPPSEVDGFKGELLFAIRHMNETSSNLSNLRRLSGVLLLCLILGGVAIAQKPAAPKKNDKVTVTVDATGVKVDGASVTVTAEDNIACGTKVQPTTGFTECEMLRISNYVAQINALQTEAQARIKPVTDAGNEFIGKVVARNPGKQYESPSQQFPLGRLVPIPPPPPTPPTPAATTPPPAAPATPPAKQ